MAQSLSGWGFSSMDAQQAVRPEERLANLMARELVNPFDAAALRAFIEAHWSKVSMLAHQIHDAPDPYVFLQAGDG